MARLISRRSFLESKPGDRRLCRDPAARCGEGPVVNRTVVFDPHLPSGWEDLSIDDVPIGTNLISFSRARTGRGIEYRIGSKQSGWTLILKGETRAGARYYVNGRPVARTAAGIRLQGRQNHVLVVQK